MVFYRYSMFEWIIEIYRPWLGDKAGGGEPGHCNPRSMASPCRSFWALSTGASSRERSLSDLKALWDVSVSVVSVVSPDFRMEFSKESYRQLPGWERLQQIIESTEEWMKAQRQRKRKKEKRRRLELAFASFHLGLQGVTFVKIHSVILLLYLLFRNRTTTFHWIVNMF